jgi:PKD repeat protein
MLLAVLVLGIAASVSHPPGAQAQTVSVATNGPYTATTGQTIFMSASVGASGAVGTQFLWNFGDGTSGSGQTVQKVYTNPGVYTVTVQVQTNMGFGTASTTATITGSGTGTGQVSAGGPYTGTVGQPIVMTGTLNLLGATAFNWFWNFGDGTTGQGQSVTKTYTTAGTFTVTLQVQTGAGVSTATTTATISGQGGTGQVSAGGPYTGAVGQPITMFGTLNLLGATATAWTWNFGDGTSGSGQTVTKTYTTAGTFTVTLTVQLSTGISSSATTTATIGGGTTPTQTTTVSLFAGCNNVASTWPNSTPTSTVSGAVSPAGSVTGVWRLDAATNRYLGFSPNVAQGVNDLPTVDKLNALFVCTSTAATLTRPIA